jgi:hypothetical protein
MRWLGKYVTHKWMILEPWADHLPRRRAKLGRSRTTGAEEGGVSLPGGGGVASKSNRAPFRRAYMQQRFVILLLSASCLERGEDEAGR